MWRKIGGQKIELPFYVATATDLCVLRLPCLFLFETCSRGTCAPIPHPNTAFITVPLGTVPPSQGPYPFIVMRWLCRLSSRSAAGEIGRLPPCWVLSLSATSCLDRKAS